LITIYAATSNPGKLREFQRAAPDFDVQALPAGIPPPDETGDTFEANAIQKALAYSNHVNGFLFADDSGLSVDALNGAPGVHSARYAGTNFANREENDAANNALLLERLRGVTNRTARFVCVIALVKQGEWIKTFRGAVEGRIIEELRGSGGFGYDPLFYHDPFGCTFGEALLEQKITVSHRAIALEQMFTYLRSSAASAGSQRLSSRP
jgi:XTP/dITP diphosphohydrolase